MRTRSPQSLALDEQSLALLSDCLLEVRSSLTAHGVKTDDQALLEWIALALLAKVRDGESDPRKLIAYACFRAWGRLRRLD